MAALHDTKHGNLTERDMRETEYFNLLTDRTGYHLVPVDCTGGRRFKLVEL